jgi:hypothetical protein
MLPDESSETMMSMTTNQMMTRMVMVIWINKKKNTAQQENEPSPSPTTIMQEGFDT